MNIKNESYITILNNYFDKIFLLTIERNEERLKTTKKILHGLNYEIFFGVDGSKLDLAQLKKSGLVSNNIDAIYEKSNIDYMNMPSPPIHINQIACALSHVEIYKKIRSSGNFNRVLILEDDTALVESNLQYLSETLKQVPEDWEVLYLGHIINNNFSFWGKFKYYYLTHFIYRIGIRTKAIIRKKNTYPLPFSSLLRKQGAHIGTHAYAVKANAVDKLIKLQEPLEQVAPDLLLMDAIVKKIVVSYSSKYVFFEQNPNLHSSIWSKQN